MNTTREPDGFSDKNIVLRSSSKTAFMYDKLKVPISEGTLSGNSYPLIYKLKPNQSLKLCLQMMCWKMLKFRMKTMFL